MRLFRLSLRGDVEHPLPRAAPGPGKKCTKIQKYKAPGSTLRGGRVLVLERRVLYQNPETVNPYDSLQGDRGHMLVDPFIFVQIP